MNQLSSRRALLLALAAALTTAGCGPAASPAARGPAARPVTTPQSPCELADAGVISSVVGIPFDPGVVSNATSAPGGSTQPICLFRPTGMPDAGEPAVTAVSIGLVAPAEFARVRHFSGNPEVAVHAIVLPGATDAFEMFGGTVGVVYAQRGAVRLDVSVTTASGADTATEERIAEVLVNLLQ